MEEKGLYFLLKNFNLGLYALCGNAPLYIGKIFLGAFYGLIVGFMLGFWKREILYNGLLVFSSILILTKLDCIACNWQIIYQILGVTTLSFSSESFFNVINEYAIEISTFILIVLIVKKTIEKQRNFLL